MVNEKTLELNVSTNMINDLRFIHPNAYLYGFDMRWEEPRNGLDSSLNLPGANRLLAFQFKAPKGSSGNIFWFKFNKGAHFHQHNILHVTADATNPQPTVYYVLPAYPDMILFENDSPNFLDRTYFINVFDTPLIFDEQSHEFEIDTHNMTFIIHSKSDMGKGKIKNWETIKKDLISEKIGTSVSQFNEKISNFKVSINNENEYRRPYRTSVSLNALII